MWFSCCVLGIFSLVCFALLVPVQVIASKDSSSQLHVKQDLKTLLSHFVVNVYSFNSVIVLSCLVDQLLTCQYLSLRSNSFRHKHGNRRSQGNQLLPQHNYWGSNLYILLPQFFSVTYIKRNLTKCKVISNAKILKNFLASGALPQTPLYTAYTFFEKYILHKVIL